MLAMAEDMQDLLIDAIMQSDLAAIARLIERGASPDRLSECDMTPLMFAVEHELVDSIEALVRAGANSGGAPPIFGLARRHSSGYTVYEQEGGARVW
jgi:ankyrin repeat protein